MLYVCSEDLELRNIEKKTSKNGSQYLLYHFEDEKGNSFSLYSKNLEYDKSLKKSDKVGIQIEVNHRYGSITLGNIYKLK